MNILKLYGESALNSLSNIFNISLTLISDMFVLALYTQIQNNVQKEIAEWNIY